MEDINLRSRPNMLGQLVWEPLHPCLREPTLSTAKPGSVDCPGPSSSVGPLLNLAGLAIRCPVNPQLPPRAFQLSPQSMSTDTSTPTSLRLSYVNPSHNAA